MRLERHGLALVVYLAAVCILGTTPPAAAGTIFVDDDAPGDPGPGNPSVSDPQESGSAAHPFDAIQEGINAAFSDDVVVVADGTYSGPGNKNLDFGGRAITVRSQNGPDTCVINCLGSGRGFYFHNGEGDDSVVYGFTITGGNVSDGAAVYCFECGPTLANCRMIQNTASFRGGAIVCEGGGPTIVNCSIAENGAAWYAGGILCYESDAAVVNCTITGNTTNWYGGGLVCAGGEVAVANCILWGNVCANGPQLALSWNAEVSFRYCTIEGGQAAVHCEPGCSLDWGPGNLVADPLLTPAGRPQSGSPCIDAGDNNAVPEGTTTDLDGLPRFVNDPLTPDTGDAGTAGPPIVDMGAYEYQVLPGDFDGDGSVDLDDYGLIAGCFTGPRSLSPADFNADGTVDLEDLAWWAPCLAGPGSAPSDGCQQMDLQEDDDVDLSDFAAFQRMFDYSIEPLPLQCGPTNLDDDFDVDVSDFAAFQTSFTG